MSGSPAPEGPKLFRFHIMSDDGTLSVPCTVPCPDIPSTALSFFLFLFSICLEQIPHFRSIFPSARTPRLFQTIQYTQETCPA